MVGVTGIEPAKSWSQTKRLTIGPHPEVICLTIIAESFAFVKGEKDFLKTLLFLLFSFFFKVCKKGKRVTLLALDLSPLLCYNKATNHERQ